MIKKLINSIEFDSNDNDFNEFLYEESLYYCKLNLSVVYLVFYENNLVAYFSLSSDSIKTNKKLNIKLKYYPAMKIGLLAVDKKISMLWNWCMDYSMGNWFYNGMSGGVMG